MNIVSFALVPTQSLCNPALHVSSRFAERAEKDRASGNPFEIRVYGGNSYVSTRNRTTTPSIL